MGLARAAESLVSPNQHTNGTRSTGQRFTWVPMSRLATSVGGGLAGRGPGRDGLVGPGTGVVGLGRSHELPQPHRSRAASASQLYRT